jgi:hypothetical protein
LLQGGDPPLVVFDAMIGRAIFTQQIAHLTNGACYRYDLGDQAHLRFGLATLEALEADVRVFAQSIEARVRGVDTLGCVVAQSAHFVANATENLDRKIAWLHVRLDQYAFTAEQEPDQRPISWICGETAAEAVPRRPSG